MWSSLSFISRVMAFPPLDVVRTVRGSTPGSRGRGSFRLGSTRVAGHRPACAVRCVTSPRKRPKRRAPRGDRRSPSDRRPRRPRRGRPHAIARPRAHGSSTYRDQGYPYGGPGSRAKLVDRSQVRDYLQSLPIIPVRPTRGRTDPDRREHRVSRPYETVLIFDSSMDESQIEEKVERFKRILSGDRQNAVQSVPWGKRKLAYPIG